MGTSGYAKDPSGEADVDVEIKCPLLCDNWWKARIGRSKRAKPQDAGVERPVIRTAMTNFEPGRISEGA